ncbi:MULTISPECIES: hypothetical protein [unclassified Thauera]|uniref:hypothetical protein n=1 Tax=unclassified Thauera TaxID=2609274 RepID=UPI0012FA2177|nr:MULTISPECIES: hypothetical protein [unclassified Thauera]WBL62984.1 hypothetical protein LQF09_12930 [Thauera sp. WB-2]HNR61749.1 hypothetical protein [Thauera sp.]HNS93434.1 hypothetical protein [Thauera sp.]HRJ23562.1 hypothetical protein [Thauera sp.]HRK10797.1 hypothetical protein [Thauera sp.]
MKRVAVIVLGIWVCLSAGVARAETPPEPAARTSEQVPVQQNGQEAKDGAGAMQASPDNRASLLSIVLVAGVMIVVGRAAIAFAKNKMDAELLAAKAQADLDQADRDAQAKG